MTEAWNGSEAIFVGTVLDVEKFDIPTRHNWLTMVGERVRFQVDRVFKGDIRPGDDFVTETNVSPGSCGRSAINDPVWLEIVQEDGSDLRDSSQEMFKQWLVYSWRGSPHSVEAGSSPLEIAVDRGDIALLEGHEQASSSSR